MKQAIRQRIIAQRQQIPKSERARWSRSIAARIAEMAPYRSAKMILAYMNFGAEFESEILVQQVLADGKTLLLPRVNPAMRELELYHVEDVDTQLAPGAYGIREPIAERCERLVKLEEIEFILMPGVAFGRDGARLGYGGGFFDKLLARMVHKPVLVACAYSMQVVANIPMEANDRRVDWLVTESETIHCMHD